MSRAPSLRFPIDPRDVMAAKAARRLGLTEQEFDSIKERLFARGFPRPDPDTGLYDLKAIEEWMDRRSNLTSPRQPRDAASGFASRLEGIRGGKAS